MKSLQEIIEKIEKYEAELEVRTIRRMEIGSAIHQGDVYVHRMPEDWQHGKQIGEGQVQVALGVGNGARHIAEGDLNVFEGQRCPPGVVAMEGVDEKTITGPVIKAKKPWTLKHPEHAHHKLPAGVYGVTYQFDPRTMKRVID